MHYKKGPRSTLISIEKARTNATPLSFENYTPKVPNNLGVTILDTIDLNEVRKYIDWTPFFRTWELAGTFPKILDDPKVGKVARDLHADAKAMLEASGTAGALEKEEKKCAFAEVAGSELLVFRKSVLS